MQRRVVVTGLGVLAANGIGKENFWKACISGRSGIRRITRFDPSSLVTQIAGEIQDFDPQMLGLTPEECTGVDRGTQLAIAASNLAFQDAGLSDGLSEEERDRSGVYMGTAISSMENGEKLWVQLRSQGVEPLSAEISGAIPAGLRMINAPATAVAAHHQFHGPSTVIATGCSAGADAIGQAFWLILLVHMTRTATALSWQKDQGYCSWRNESWPWHAMRTSMLNSLLSAPIVTRTI